MNFIKKTRFIFFTFITILGFISCTQIIKSTNENAEAASISFQINESARTIMPSADLTKYTYSVAAKQDSGNEETLISKKSYSEFQSASVNVAVGEWTFIVSVYNGETKILSGSVTETLKAGETKTLSFLLNAETSGKGSVSISLQFPNDKYIKTVTAGIYDTPIAKDSGETLSIANSTDNSGYSMVTFKKGNVPAGITQFVKFFLYNNEGDCAGSYVESVYVVPGLTSSKTVTVDEINNTKADHTLDLGSYLYQTTCANWISSEYINSSNNYSNPIYITDCFSALPKINETVNIKFSGEVWGGSIEKVNVYLYDGKKYLTDTPIEITDIKKDIKSDDKIKCDEIITISENADENIYIIFELTASVGYCWLVFDGTPDRPFVGWDDNKLYTPIINREVNSSIGWSYTDANYLDKSNFESGKDYILKVKINSVKMRDENPVIYDDYLVYTPHIKSFDYILDVQDTPQTIEIPITEEDFGKPLSFYGYDVIIDVDEITIEEDNREPDYTPDLSKVLYPATIDTCYYYDITDCFTTLPTEGETIRISFKATLDKDIDYMRICLYTPYVELSKTKYISDINANNEFSFDEIFTLATPSSSIYLYIATNETANINIGSEENAIKYCNSGWRGNTVLLPKRGYGDNLSKKYPISQFTKGKVYNANITLKSVADRDSQSGSSLRIYIGSYDEENTYADSSSIIAVENSASPQTISLPIAISEILNEEYISLSFNGLNKIIEISDITFTESATASLIENNITSLIPPSAKFVYEEDMYVYELDITNAFSGKLPKKGDFFVVYYNVIFDKDFSCSSTILDENKEHLYYYEILEGGAFLTSDACFGETDKEVGLRSVVYPCLEQSPTKLYFKLYYTKDELDEVVTITRGN